MKKKKNIINEKESYLDNLTRDDLLTIIKYGLKNSNVPPNINVEDIFSQIAYVYWMSCK